MFHLEGSSTSVKIDSFTILGCCVFLILNASPMTAFLLSLFPYHFFFSVFKRGVPPAEQPFIVEDMPQMHRFVYDYYSHYVESLRAQREV